MRHPEQIPKLGLVELLVKIREALYFDADKDDWDRDRIYAHGDQDRLVFAVDDLLAAADLVPPHEPSAACACPTCEAANADNRTAPQERLPASGVPPGD